MDLCRAYEHSTALSMAGLLRHTSILCKVQGTDGRFNVQKAARATGHLATG